MLPGRRWACSQLAEHQGRRLPFSVEPGGGLPLSCTTYSQHSTTIVLFFLYMRLSLNSRTGALFFSQLNFAQLYASAVWKFEATISAVTVVKLPLDGLLLVIMLILARKGRHSRATVVILFYRWLSCHCIILHWNLETLYAKCKVFFVFALEKLWQTNWWMSSLASKWWESGLSAL